MKESSLKKKLEEGLKSRYPRCLYDPVVQCALTGKGRPDANVIATALSGDILHVSIESKIYPRKPTPIQAYRAGEICKAGGVSVWVSERDGVLSWYDAENIEIVSHPIKEMPEDILEKCRNHVRGRGEAWSHFKAIKDD